MQSINEDVQKDPWGIVSYWPTRIHAADYHPLGLVIQSTHFSIHLIVSSSSPYINSQQRILLCQRILHSVKDLSEVQVDDICCSPLIYQANHFIMEVKQIA